MSPLGGPQGGPMGFVDDNLGCPQVEGLQKDALHDVVERSQGESQKGPELQGR